MYSNTLNNVKQLSKKMYYHNEVETNKNNPKRMWNVLHTLLPNGKKTGHTRNTQTHIQRYTN